jgi:hypothetical protein
MGKRVPNLVLVYDSGSGSEFRVQCEVTLPDEPEADAIKNDLITASSESLRRAKKKVMDRIDAKANPAFKTIVDDAFENNIQLAEVRERQ